MTREFTWIQAYQFENTWYLSLKTKMIIEKCAMNQFISLHFINQLKLALFIPYKLASYSQDPLCLMLSVRQIACLVTESIRVTALSTEHSFACLHKHNIMIMIIKMHDIFSFCHLTSWNEPMHSTGPHCYKTQVLKFQVHFFSNRISQAFPLGSECTNQVAVMIMYFPHSLTATNNISILSSRQCSHQAFPWKSKPTGLTFQKHINKWNQQTDKNLYSNGFILP